MKQDDLLLYGAGALAVWYFFLRPKKAVVIPAPIVAPVATTPTTTIAPVTTHVPTTGLLTPITAAIAPVITPSPIINKIPLTSTSTTIIATPIVNDSAYQTFINKDYPGALAGYIEEEKYN